MLPDRIVLIGPSGSGKSATAKRLSALTGYAVVDTDAAIVARIGMPIAEFFQRFGEPAFRAIECEELRIACAQSDVVVATGGGVVMEPANWATMRPGSVIAGLSAEPATLLNRIRQQTDSAGASAIRPLLSGDAERQLTSMLQMRSAFYSQADITVDTDRVTPDGVAARILEACNGVSQRLLVPRLCLDAGSGRSDIYIGAGCRRSVGELAQKRWPGARRVWIVSDTNVDAAWGKDVEAALSERGLDVTRLLVQPGEQSKSIGEVERLCAEMTSGGVTRRDVVVALGGGVVGDLAGFVASVCLRGLPLIQIPTSLLAMVDSSVGGKTGVNLPAGKNLAGAFCQAGIVLIDPEFLESLPRTEYRSGMAEVIKHSVIQPSTPLGGTTLARLLDSAPLDPIPAQIVEDALTLNVAVKHSVVQADEREGGLRMILNFGHTVGHAIEADGYRYRHGEAVAIGMLAALQIAVLLDQADADQINRLTVLLHKAGLPTSFDGDVSEIVTRMARDKKNVDGSLHWILPQRDGGVEIRSGVDAVIVERAIRSVHRAQRAAGSGLAVL